MPLTVRHIGMRFECGKGHVKFEPWNKEARKQLKEDAQEWRGCSESGCPLITFGQPYGLMSVLEAQ